MIAWVGRSAAGLRIPADLPALDIESSIARSFTAGPGGLLLPNQPEYLPAYPIRAPWFWAPARIPWEPLEPLEPGGFLRALADAMIGGACTNLQLDGEEAERFDPGTDPPFTVVDREIFTSDG